MTPRADWKHRAAPGPRPAFDRAGWIAGRRKAWRLLAELATEFAGDPRGDALHLVHQAIVCRSARLRGADPVFAGLGNAGEAAGRALAALAETVKDASDDTRALVAPALRELAALVEAFVIEAQTRAAAGWKSQMGED